MVIRYILGFLISLAVVLIYMPSLISYLKRQSLRQSISEYSLPEDQKKAGTPIMGGIMFIVVPVIVTLLMDPSQFMNLDTMTVLLAFIGYGLIGFTDDYLIAIRKNNDGLLPRYKFALQVVLAVLFFFLYRSRADLTVHIPFTSTDIPLGWGYFVLVLFMFAGSSNAVNLTDGMDGLAAGCTLVSLIPFLIFSLVKGKTGIALFVITLIGALLGYLYYNKKPARIFMGDTGSLALGGVLAAMAMILKTEFALIFVGGIFVLETLCVIIQIGSVKIRHKKVFIYTPIHYAFRIKGMPETSVVRMFWLAEAVLAVIGLWLGLH